MKKYNLYIKNLSLFMILEMFIVFICSLLNLINVSTSITTILLFVFNVFIFLLFSYMNGIKTNRRGFISGFLTGFILLVILYLVNVLFFKGDFNINQILYYIILLLSSTFGGMYGKTKKKEDIS